MKQRLLVLFAALCLLLSACGLPVQLPESVLDASEASREAETPMDPEELGDWLLEKMYERQEEHFAYDMDMDMTFQLMLEGEDMEEIKSSSRSRSIRREDGTTAYQMEMESEGSRTSLWHDDGMLYLDSDYGSYKVEMDPEEFQQEYLGGVAGKVLSNPAVNKQMMRWIGTIRGQETEDGYILTYGDLSPECWNLISGMLGGMLAEIDGNLRDLTMDGTITLDRQGNILGQELVETVEMDSMGMTARVEVVMRMDVNCYDEQVTIKAPKDDEDFREMSDVEIPQVFANGYGQTLWQDELRYQDTLTLRVADEVNGLEDVYIQSDEIRSTVDLGGLNVEWDTGHMKNDQVIGWSQDIYSGGQGTVTDESGEQEYSYDDESFASDIAEFMTLYTDSFEEGNDYQMEEDGTRRRLTYTFSEDYAAYLLRNFLESYGTGVDYREAMEADCRGSMTIWFDETGAMVEQKLEASAELTFETGVISVTVEDHGTVLAA